jgi:hypothetical protein
MVAYMVRTSRNRTAAVVKCNRMAGMEAKPADPIRDLAIEIVEIFAGLLREDEMRDALSRSTSGLRGDCQC